MLSQPHCSQISRDNRLHPLKDENKVKQKKKKKKQSLTCQKKTKIKKRGLLLLHILLMSAIEWKSYMYVHVENSSSQTSQ